MNFEILLKERIGLDPSSVGSTAIDRAVRSRMDALSIRQQEQYWEELHTSTHELQRLIDAVIVPETWFFRGPEAYSSLTRLIWEEWLPNHPTSELRLLSVPCCTGEEPFSMVMALLDAGMVRERIKVDAVDVSLGVLSRAKLGVYSENSFRGDSLDFRGRYFKRTGKGYSIPDWFKDIVTFHHENMVSPTLRAGVAPYDVIFCRNALIYFDRNMQLQAMERLSLLLARGGFLFVGPAEAFLAMGAGFKSVNHSMSFAFRRDSQGKARGTHTQIPEPKPLRRKPSLKHQMQLPAKAAASIPSEPIAPRIDLEEADRLADLGRLREAAEVCELHLKETGPSGRAYYLLGILADAGGNVEMAADYYRKVLFLQPNHADALLHLALLSERQGNKAMAQRMRERAKRAEAAGQHPGTTENM